MKYIFRIDEVAKLNQSSITNKDKFELINYLDTSSITKGKIDSWQELKHNYPSRAKRKIKQNTIVYSTVRPNQEHYGFFNSIEKENAIVSTGFATIDVFSDNVEPIFLYYLLTQKWVTNHLHTIAENSVSAYPSINPSDIGNLRFRFPNLTKQKKIANILSDIDNKINLNNQINDNLDICKTLYDYWFVQFDFPNETESLKSAVARCLE
ncbi:restriction endonuclease subunit M [Chryseobacterium bernardetii]|uniref:Restriction endonuclease subunit M n=2 Tax=Chryseobacterium bernardetii TaxID=1241978 RepID=A0A3G6TDF8_9FLAO|nr:restriction endonuclease subunit S [Chryseobacterium bernardetii]AZB25977.1 restriction endonuclease subunit M [Chryseobacterium bernardetii]